MGEVNLWKETLSTLKKNCKKWDDVLYISNLGKNEAEALYFEIPKDDFKEIAETIDYDNGWGGNEINMNLVIAGNGWWMERSEYDGSEWWSFKKQPEKPLLTLSQAKALLVDFNSKLFILED